MCGLDRDGAAYCWGTNIGGELGSGTTVQNTSVPGPVSGGLSFVGLAAGTNHACALTRDGAAYCWGSNELQELGTGDTVRRLVPTLVSGGLSFSTLAAGGDHTCGIAKSGAAYCWGGNIYGQLGSGSSQNPSGVPLAVSGGLTFTAITAGAGHTCAIASSGTVYCWGANSDGQRTSRSHTLRQYKSWGLTSSHTSLRAARIRVDSRARARRTVGAGIRMEKWATAIPSNNSVPVPLTGA